MPESLETEGWVGGGGEGMLLSVHLDQAKWSGKPDR